MAWLHFLSDNLHGIELKTGPSMSIRALKLRCNVRETRVLSFPSVDSSTALRTVKGFWFSLHLESPAKHLAQRERDQQQRGSEHPERPKMNDHRRSGPGAQHEGDPDSAEKADFRIG